MKISYIIPTGEYEFFRDVVPMFQSTPDVYVEVNQISSDTDLILLGIMPLTPEWIKRIRRSGKPYVAWHWDYYSFVDFTQPRWDWFLNSCLPRAADIWSCTYEVARQLKEVFGLDSYMMPSWVNDQDPRLVSRDPENFVFYASSSAAFGKRVEWAEYACNLAGYRLELIRGRALTRDEYFDRLSRCRVYLMTAFEESNATIPTQEAGAIGKPVVLADIPASREIFGDKAYYFNNWDFRDLLRALRAAWDGGPIPGVRKRIVSNYGIEVVFQRMLERLRYVHARVS